MGNRRSHGTAAEEGRRAYKETYERVHGLGQGREAKDLESLSRHAQFEHFENIRWVDALKSIIRQFGTIVAKTVKYQKVDIKIDFMWVLFLFLPQ